MPANIVPPITPPRSRVARATVAVLLIVVAVVVATSTAVATVTATPAWAQRLEPEPDPPPPVTSVTQPTAPVPVPVSVQVESEPAGSAPSDEAAPPVAPTPVSPPITVFVSGPVNSANATYAAEVYQQLLGRAADDAGLDFHLARLASGGDRGRRTFAHTLAFSVEGSRREVIRAYADLLGRTPDPAGETYWTAHLQGRSVLDLRVLLAASNEYANRAGGGDGGWIDALYLDLLGRAADGPGRQYWLERVGAGVPRALIAASIHQGEESLGRRAQTLHQEVLGRAASGSEQAGAVAVLRSGDERDLRAGLIASDEAYEPFLDAVLP